MPDVGLIDAVEDQVREPDRIDDVVFFTAVERSGCEALQVIGGGVVSKVAADVLVGLSEEAAGAATGVVDGLAHPGAHDADHGADDLARGEELTAVVVPFAHAEQEAFVGLGEGEDVTVVDGADLDRVDAVEDVEEVLLRVDADALDAGHDLADDLLARRGARPGCQATEMREEVAVDEGEQRAEGTIRQRLALGATRGGPVPPAVRGSEGAGEGGAHGLGLLRLDLLTLVENAEEEDPCQFRDVLEGPGAVRAPEDVADAVDGGVEGLLAVSRR